MATATDCSLMGLGTYLAPNIMVLIYISPPNLDLNYTESIRFS